MDLFSFLDPNAADDGNDMEMDVDATVTERAASKRKAVDASTSALADPGPSIPKKPRMASPAPMVLDDFETEAKREVAGSAGLTGSDESNSKLELRHQVRCLFLAVGKAETQQYIRLPFPL